MKLGTIIVGIVALYVVSSMGSAMDTSSWAANIATMFWSLVPLALIIAIVIIAFKGSGINFD
jgi:hypothetical protein